jgi:hypothetical protein
VRRFWCQHTARLCCKRELKNAASANLCGMCKTIVAVTSTASSSSSRGSTIKAITNACHDRWHVSASPMGITLFQNASSCCSLLLQLLLPTPCTAYKACSSSCCCCSACSTSATRSLVAESVQYLQHVICNTSTRTCMLLSRAIVCSLNAGEAGGEGRRSPAVGVYALNVVSRLICQ